jgi:hypothetical protein
MGLDQLQAGIAKLQPSIARVGLTVPDAHALAGRARGMDDPALSWNAVRDFHVELLVTLTATDFRLGKAYGLGCALADTTRQPDDVRAVLGWYRVTTLTTWIRELSSVFPAHAARAVATSLESWSSWVAGGAAADSDTRALLSAQGRLWRSMLSGEKRATDALETSDYFRAGERLLRRTGLFGLRVLVRLWWLTLIIVFLFVGGVVLIATADGGGARIGAGAAAVLASFGLSWKGIGSALGSTATRMEPPLWEAELDRVIYERITPAVVVDNHWPVDPGPDEPSLAHAGRAAAATAPHDWRAG